MTHEEWCRRMIALLEREQESARKLLAYAIRRNRPKCAERARQTIDATVAAIARLSP